MAPDRPSPRNWKPVMRKASAALFVVLALGLSAAVSGCLEDRIVDQEKFVDPNAEGVCFGDNECEPANECLIGKCKGGTCEDQLDPNKDGKTCGTPVPPKKCHQGKCGPGL